MGDQPDEAGNSRSRRMTAHWSQPCTGLSRNPSNTQQDLSKHILQALSMAHSFMIDFRTTYAKAAVGAGLEDPWDYLVNNYTSGENFDFLHTPPAENVNDFNSQLLHAYEKMQRLAVGIEQVTLDQALYQGTLLQEFRSIETHIVKILCQLHYAMVHQDLQPKANVTKEIMGEEYRDQDGTSARDMRDSIIVREYNDAINHLKDVFVMFE